MNYDRIILELMNRVQMLEDAMITMQSRVTLLENDNCEDLDEGEVFEQDEVTRSQARDKTIGIIKNKHPDFIVEKASRKEGSGIKIHSPNSKKPIIIKFYHSKEHRTGDLEHEWHVVRLNDVIGTVIDYCLFSFVDLSGNWSYFLYEQDEIGMYYDDHRPNSSNDILHLYFVVNNGKATEEREEVVDVTDHLNNWHILKKV
ncbi:hypothetical protein D3C74_48630 [compost metagenome]